MQRAFLHLRSGRPGKLPPSFDDQQARFDLRRRAMPDNSLACSIVGTREKVREATRSSRNGPERAS